MAFKIKKMKKIILIGSEGILGKYYSKNLSNKDNLLILADANIKPKKIKKNTIKIKLDIENESSIKNFFLDLKKKYGNFDVLINNAALTTEGIIKLKNNEIKKEKFDTFIWDKTLNTNLRGNFLCCKYFLKYHHVKKINQKIINIGSIYGSRSPHHAIYKGENFFSSLAYTTSKSGLIGLTKWLATKYAKENTSFNMISPAGVYNKQTPSFIKKYLELIPKGRMANPKDIFGVLKLLISEDSNYITGQNIHVDGGFTSW